MSGIRFRKSYGPADMEKQCFWTERIEDKAERCALLGYYAASSV